MGAESGVWRGTSRYLGIHVTDPAVSDARTAYFVMLLHPAKCMHQRQHCVLSVWWCDLEIALFVEIVSPFVVMMKSSS